MDFYEKNVKNQFLLIFERQIYFRTFFVKKINFTIKKAKKVSKINQFVNKYSGILEKWSFFVGFLWLNWINLQIMIIFVQKVTFCNGEFYNCR